MTIKFIVDVDVFLHRIGYSIQKKGYHFKHGGDWHGPFYIKKDLLNQFHVSKEELVDGINYYEEVEVLDVDLDLYLNDCIFELMNEISKGTRHITKGAKCEFIFVRSPLNSKALNFRYKMPNLLQYKGNRNEKPEKYIDLHQSDTWGVFEVLEPKIGEADDLIAEVFMEDPDNSIICSIDNDFKMLPCHYFNINDKSCIKVSEEDAVKNFWLKVYEGDTSDCVPGLYKCVELLKGDLRAKELKHSRYKKRMREMFFNSPITALKSLVFNEFRSHGISDEIINQHIDLIRFRKQNGNIILDH